MNPDFRLGGQYLGNNLCSFRVWAPRATKVELHLIAPDDRLVAMQRSRQGYWQAHVEGVSPGARYFYRLNETNDRPDPASAYQPNGVHEASELVNHDFDWADRDWFGLPLRDYILYELHVGTFTQEGTFSAIIPKLDHLKRLGITALELMPIAQFPGDRNWGYDGVNLFAVQNSYGGPTGLKALVNACHRVGLAVVLDVVYNHFGPEGNYLGEFGPYFNNSSQTLWGAALNYDGADSKEVRHFFLENARYWQEFFHVDALRLDAVHAIRDFSAFPFLQELAQVTRRHAERLNRRFYLIAESDLNDARYLLPTQLGGYALDAQWSDDFHHTLHVLLTGERYGYYQDFGTIRQLAKVFREGYAYTGDYSAYRRLRQGNSPQFTSSRQFVVYAQNHDQVGNRLLGDRLARIVSFEALKLAAGSVLLSPFIPMLFMGEEYAETASFQYMTSHSDPNLVKAVQEGRRQEFAYTHADCPAPDPQSVGVFMENKLKFDGLCHDRTQRLLFELYQELIRIRKGQPALAEADKQTMDVTYLETKRLIVLHYWTEENALLVLLHFGSEARAATVELPDGSWGKLLDSAVDRWGGPGSSLPEEISGNISADLLLSPQSFAVFNRIHHVS